MRHAVIMAGGAGVRLWPLSRKNRPKQTLKLFDGKSLIRHSYERVASHLPPEQIHVITNDAHLPMVKAELPELPQSNLIGEPVGRDTANAVGLACAILHEKDPDAVVGVFTADHMVVPHLLAQRSGAAHRLSLSTTIRQPPSLPTMATSASVCDPTERA